MVSTLQEEGVMVKESTVGEDDDQSLMGDLEMMETEARRMEKKRKGIEQERKSKRRKLERLVGWGEVTGGSQQTGMVKVTTTTTGDVNKVNEASRLVQESS